MGDELRITVDELRRRMEAGEDFTIVDTRRTDAWTESDTMIPESIRVSLDQLEQNLARIPKSRPVVAYCT
jgi:rhodanese-related sulfurtransferase